MSQLELDSSRHILEQKLQFHLQYRAFTLKRIAKQKHGHAELSL